MSENKMQEGLSPAELRRAWHMVCQGYLKQFCDKHGYNYADACTSWVGDIGGYVSVGDCMIYLGDIRADIDLEAPAGAFLRWYDESLEAAHRGGNLPSYRVWLQWRLPDEEQEAAE